MQDLGSTEGYDDAFREAGGDDAFRENEGGDAEDVARDQEQGHANAWRKGQGRRRASTKQAHGCQPMTIYP